MDDKENELVVIEETNNTSHNIKIADDVVAVIAGIAVSEVPGVCNMAGGFAGGISEVLSGKKNLAKGIKVEVGEKETKIDVNIIVEYGTRIPDIAFEIQNRVKKSVEAMTGLRVLEVNIHVQGVNANISEENKQETEKK
ncbi:MAG TPA: Asp23/Gls24 family envelope stress response protein [Clostridia bacterium]|nr:Asp23/Gls24 family envelope stress response protein [Clostridia bacterium]